MTNREKLKKLMKDYYIEGDVEDLTDLFSAFLTYLKEKMEKEEPAWESKISRYSRMAFDMKFVFSDED